MADTVYTVKAGDSLSKIAEKYNMNYLELARYNNIPNPNLIYINQKINIPAKYTSGTSVVESNVKKFVARLTAPKKTDKTYYSDKNIFYACGYGMPNCTAYAWGRLLELTGKAYDKLCGNAEDWWGVAEKAGLKRGKTPKLGAIVCWKAGKVKDNSDGAGHVGVVEQIKSNGDIVVSNSAWKGTEFYLMTVTKASGYVYDSSRQLQGFIYCGIEFEADSTASESSTSSKKVKAGAKVQLSNTKCYSNATTKTVWDTKTGAYYYWSDEVVNGRVRITNSASRVGVKGQVTCWIDV